MAKEKTNVKPKTKKRILSTSDVLLALFLITPFAIGFFRATWVLQDLYSVLFPPVHCYFVGGVVHLGFALVRDILNLLISNKSSSLWNRLKSQIIRRFYTYMFAVACVMHWRGGWYILDTICDNNSLYILFVAGVSLFVIILLKSVRNLIACPMVIVTDSEDVIFNFPTRYKTKSSDKISLYILDCLFSVFVIGTLVVFVWRGAWVLFDIFLFPNDFIWSSWVSLILGYTIVIVAFSLQPVMRWLCDRLTGFARILVADIYLFFSVIGTINVWRGIWNLLEIYFLPDYPKISCWTTHWVSLLLLILLNCSNSLLVRGVYIDAEEPAGKCVIFPIYYLRLIFKNEREKKHIKNIQLEAMAKRKHEIDCLKPKNENCLCNSDQNHVLLLQHTLEANHIEV